MPETVEAHKSYEQDGNEEFELEIFHCKETEFVQLQKEDYLLHEARNNLEEIEEIVG